MKRYHHLGVPTKTPHEGEVHLPQYKLYLQGFETSPCGAEWMRWEPGAPSEFLPFEKRVEK